jgi:hypothetical protein
MLLEFALEPQAIGSDWRLCKYLIEKFGFDRGRIIAQFPKAWLRSVYEASASLGDVDRMRIAEILSRVKGSLVQSRRPYDPTLGGWIDNAVTQHAIQPFHAIIASSNPGNNADILVASEIDEASPNFQASHGWVVPRTGAALADAMRPFLSYSRDIWFVDPYFSVLDGSYVETLRECLHVVASTGNAAPNIEIHFREHDKRPPIEMLEARIPRALAGVIPDGMKISLHGWRQLAGGEDLHARYLLTDRGGLSVESGFAALGAQESLDIQLLSAAICDVRRAAFARGAAIYEFVGPILHISSDGTVHREA